MLSLEIISLNICVTFLILVHWIFVFSILFCKHLVTYLKNEQRLQNWFIWWHLFIQFRKINEAWSKQFIHIFFKYSLWCYWRYAVRRFYGNTLLSVTASWTSIKLTVRVSPGLAFDVLLHHHLSVLNGFLNKTDSLRRPCRYSIVIRERRKVKCFVERFYVIFPGAISGYVLSLYGRR